MQRSGLPDVARVSQLSCLLGSSEGHALLASQERIGVSARDLLWSQAETRG